MVEKIVKPGSDGIDAGKEYASSDMADDPHATYINTQLENFREQLLGMTLRNNLLNCPHGSGTTAQIRIIDELPDAVFQRMEAGDGYTFLPLPEPRDAPDDEDSDEFHNALEEHKARSVTYQAALSQISALKDNDVALEQLEREARDHIRASLNMGIWQPERGLGREDLCRRHDINPCFELPSSDQSETDSRHHDNALQTLLNDNELSARLRLLRDRARSSISQAGVGTLFATFGFLEWFENDDSDQPHHAPLVLVPAELERQLQQGRYNYTFRSTGEDVTANVTLAVYLRQKFSLELPELDEDDSPESYFAKVTDEVCAHQKRWRVRRFLTIGIFTYSKLAIYRDLGREAWSKERALASHKNIRTLMAQSGVSDAPYAEDRDIDADKAASATPILIDDADSSQHSAIADVIAGKNLTIYGPPGTGKSQTITNVIASAMMAGKTVLFVAEKLTALEVVWDRLEKAGLGPFCFKLHAQGMKSTVARSALEERVNMPNPDFDSSRYRQQKEDWEKQRSALATYARIMGTKVGQLDETVHDILWRSISLRASENDFAESLVAVQLSGVETVTTADVNESRVRVKQLEKVEEAARLAASGDSPSPWRGLQRGDLLPPEIGQALHLIENWQQSLVTLGSANRGQGLSKNDMTIDEIHVYLKGVKLVQQFPDAMAYCDLVTLTQQGTREAIAQAAARNDRLGQISEELKNQYGIDKGEFPQSDNLRALITEASALAVSDLSPEAIGVQIQELRQRADTHERINKALERLRVCFGIGAGLVGADETIKRAAGILHGTDIQLLSSRTDSLMTHEAGRILNRAETQVRNLQQLRDELAQRFDLGSLPPLDDLRSAIRILNAVRGPVFLMFLNGPARRAMKLYRELSLKQVQPSANDAASDLRGLAEYLEKIKQLEDDIEIADCLSPHWRGLDSDLSEVRRVVEWAADVANQFAGTSGGHAETREALLFGDMDRLAEIHLITAELPSDWRHVGSEFDAPEARGRATRLEDLVEKSRAWGLDDVQPISRAHEVATLIDEHRSLSAEMDVDETLRQVFSIQTPDQNALNSVRLLADAMSSLDLSDATWSQVAELSARTPDADNEEDVLAQALTTEEESWSQCRTVLELDEREFLDGEFRTTVPLPALINRCIECRNMRDALLPWSAFQRARASVQNSHAAPVLAAIEESDVPLARLSEAYEWALHRSLATIVYRRYPQIAELTGWQLRNHRDAFQDLEARLQKLEQQRIAHDLFSRPVEHGESFGGPRAFTEKALILHQLSLQRSSVTLRHLIRRAGIALRQMKPCFMMSPTTVAELLPHDAELFDIVIIDEASQMLPCDALGAIARSQQAVIVGDPKQLPPSNYFQGGSAGFVDDDDSDGALATIVESILDLSLAAWRPPRHLQWHYRSRHSSLIQFSNARFYDNRLIVFPGPNEDQDESGVRYHHVEEGLYKGGLNPVEAEHVVNAACAFMEDPKNRELSLAIVAMNQRQRDRIDEMLDRETARNPAMARYRKRWRNTLHPFIVRNLETVQGDERDVIFISTVYGRETPGGAVMRRFGPITHAGGERRLNVLFSRARLRMEVFSSMQANDIAAGAGVSEGVRVLHDYLEYAATGRIESGKTEGQPTESPFEDHVAKRLRDQGLEVEPQVGVAGYRIDLGVKHRDYPHGYLLGVECDGATYHSARSVRDRDRLREAVLRDLGWEIYRIWSTDWFSDSDGEMRKLMSHIEALLEARRAGSALGDGESALVGQIVEQPTEPPRVDIATSEDDSGANPTDEQVVEIGDTILYRHVGDSLETRRVTIVRGPDAPEKWVINDSKPLAIALLGAAVGETVTVRQPTSEIDIVVTRIERPKMAQEGSSPSGAPTPDNGVTLAPYREWRGIAPDPRSESFEEATETLFDIIETEGPVLESRAYRAYTNASSARRLGPQMRRSLNRALANLEHQKRVMVEQTSGGSGYRNALLRVPEGARVTLREIGPRTFDEVPLSELSLLLRGVQAVEPGSSPEEIYRHVLARYGLVRMTEQVRKRFKDATDNSDPLNG